MVVEVKYLDICQILLQKKKKMNKEKEKVGTVTITRVSPPERKVQLLPTVSKTFAEALLLSYMCPLIDMKERYMKSHNFLEQLDKLTSIRCRFRSALLYTILHDYLKSGCDVKILENLEYQLYIPMQDKPNFSNKIIWTWADQLGRDIHVLYPDGNQDCFQNRSSLIPNPAIVVCETQQELYDGTMNI